MNASTFTARIAASTGADCAAAMSAAVGALSGPLHGGAPTRVLKMLDEVEASGDAAAYVRDILDRGERIMGFGHRVYRAEDPRARVLRRTARELELAARRGRRGARGGGAGGAAGEVARPRPRDERRVLGRGRARHREHPARHVPGDVRLRARRRLVGAHRRAAPDGAADPPVGAVRRPARTLAGRSVTLAEAAAEASALADAGAEQELAVLRSPLGRRGRGGGSLRRLSRARRRLPRDRAVPLPAEDRAAAARPRGREPGLPGLGAPLARAALTRPSGRRERRSAAAARARRERRQRRRAPAGDRRAAQRVAAAGHDRDPDRARERRRAEP